MCTDDPESLLDDFVLRLFTTQGNDPARLYCRLQDGLLTAGYTDFINRIHNQIPQVTSDGKRLQVLKGGVCKNKPGMTQFDCHDLRWLGAGDRVLGHAPLVRCEETVGAHHALPHLGGPEGRGLGARDRAPRGRACQPQGRPPLGAAGQEPRPGQLGVFTVSCVFVFFPHFSMVVSSCFLDISFSTVARLGSKLCN